LTPAVDNFPEETFYYSALLAQVAKLLAKSPSLSATFREAAFKVWRGRIAGHFSPALAESHTPACYQSARTAPQAGHFSTSHQPPFAERASQPPLMSPPQSICFAIKNKIDRC